VVDDMGYVDVAKAIEIRKHLGINKKQIPKVITAKNTESDMELAPKYNYMDGKAKLKDIDPKLKGFMYNRFQPGRKSNTNSCNPDSKIFKYRTASTISMRPNTQGGC